MAKVAIIGAGFAGHTAALYLGNALGKDHQITMINQADRFLFVPSLVWVGIGRMEPDKTRFRLQPVYERMHVNFVHGRATEIHPDEQFSRIYSAHQRPTIMNIKSWRPRSRLMGRGGPASPCGDAPTDPVGGRPA